MQISQLIWYEAHRPTQGPSRLPRNEQSQGRLLVDLGAPRIKAFNTMLGAMGGVAGLHAQQRWTIFQEALDAHPLPPFGVLQAVQGDTMKGSRLSFCRFV